MRTSRSELQQYEAATPKSRALYQESQDFFPGGETRSSAFWPPYPLTITRGQGSHVWDVDGNDRVDFVNNFTTLVLGHNHPAVTEAIQNQLKHGTSFFGSTEPQMELAKLLKQRLPSMEHIRFTNSGTEATMNCVRVSRAFTGKAKIAKIEGGYHGTHEALSVSVAPPVAQTGRAERPTQVASDPGLPQSVVDNIVVLPYNNVAAARQLIIEHKDELAAVIVEPVMGSSGMVPATAEYLKMLREVTAQSGILLIFDEVITFQLSPGGAQAWHGITPDLTALAKIIGGGLPAGAFGGRKDVMSYYDQRPGTGHASLNHSGTFNAHPLAMVAGVATMKQLTPEAYTKLNTLGNSLRNQVQQVCNELEVPAQVTGVGSLFGIHFTRQPVHNYRDAMSIDPELRHEVFLGLLNEGYFLNPKMLGSLSTAVTQREVDGFANALRKVLVRLSS